MTYIPCPVCVSVSTTNVLDAPVSVCSICTAPFALKPPPTDLTFKAVVNVADALS